MRIIPKVAISILALATSADAELISTFDTDNEGWTIVTNGNAAGHQATGGNPGGYIEHVFAGPAPTAIAAPSKFLGDWSSFDGGQISYDHLVGAQTNVVSTFNHQLRIEGSTGVAVWDGPAAAAPDSGWSSYVADLNESNWSVSGATWGQILSDVNQLSVRIELYANAGGIDVEGIDNFRVSAIPEPKSIGLLLCCSVGFFLRHRANARKTSS